MSNKNSLTTMFYYATNFNQDISGWNVSSVTSMVNMFAGASSFNQYLSSWDVDQVTFCNSFSSNTPAWLLSKPNFTSC